MVIDNSINSCPINRSYYSSTIEEFLRASSEKIYSTLSINNEFTLEQTQRDAWLEEIRILKNVLLTFQGSIYFEYSIPRMGKRIDVVIIIKAVIFILEFKIGEKEFKHNDIDQVMDYALDLKNFHESSHDQLIAPILIATNAKKEIPVIAITPQKDKLLFPIKVNIELLTSAIENILQFCDGNNIDKSKWELGRYCPTPTIIEAAITLYNNHTVEDISRRDADAINLSQTSNTISDIIHHAKEYSKKIICFVTGVPGAGKTLVGLDIATNHFDKANDMYSVYLSGNGPLVAILREALARDKVKREISKGRKIRKGDARSEVKMFIQNVHNFRDECLIDEQSAPIEHVAIFDEAQRAWNLKQTSNFMLRKKHKSNFNQSEPHFLISCLDRHIDWAVVICLVGGGQEINTGEAGISEWFHSLERSFEKWEIYISSQLNDSEYNAGESLNTLIQSSRVKFNDSLHLAVSMRSFRAENVSLLIKQLLDLQIENAKETLKKVDGKYPIVITRELSKAKQWLKDHALGSERYGIVVSSQAERLKPNAIFVKSPIDPVRWFLDGKDDVRSSYYLEDVATEFDVQGLELDWVCITWDADFRYKKGNWEHWSFKGKKWNKIKKEERKIYLKNAYRVLLTRARQGMIIVVPNGDEEDHTRIPAFYDSTFEYLKEIGFKEI